MKERKSWLVPFRPRRSDQRITAEPFERFSDGMVRFHIFVVVISFWYSLGYPQDAPGVAES